MGSRRRRDVPKRRSERWGRGEAASERERVSRLHRLRRRQYLWWPDTALAADLWGESFSRALARFRPSSHPDIEKGLQELASVWELALGDLAKDHAKRLVDFKVMRA